MSVQERKTMFQLNETGGKPSIIIEQRSLVKEKKQIFGHVDPKDKPDDAEKTSSVRSLSANFEPPKKSRPPLSRGTSLNIEIVSYSDKKEKEREPEEQEEPKRGISVIRSLYEKGKLTKSKTKKEQQKPMRQVSADIEARKAAFQPVKKTLSEPETIVNLMAEKRDFFERKARPKPKESTIKIEVIEKPQPDSRRRDSVSSSSSSSSSDDDDKEGNIMKSKKFNEVRDRLNQSLKISPQASHTKAIKQPANPPQQSFEIKKTEEVIHKPSDSENEEESVSREDIKNNISRLLEKKMTSKNTDIKEFHAQRVQRPAQMSNPEDFITLEDYDVRSPYDPDSDSDQEDSERKSTHKDESMHSSNHGHISNHKLGEEPESEPEPDY